MTAAEYIFLKQTQWALNHGIQLIGSKGSRGRPAYTTELSQNLFEPLEPSVLQCFSKGNGNEIIGSVDSPAKMQAIHSSSALGVNVFQYWQRINQISAVAAACGFCRKGNNVSKRIVFEDKYQLEGIKDPIPYQNYVTNIRKITRKSIKELSEIAKSKS